MKYLFLLYKKTYNKNIYCHYTSSCITETNISLYVFLYNKNIYCHYTSSCITETNILLYVFLYNKIFNVIIHLLV